MFFDVTIKAITDRIFTAVLALLHQQVPLPQKICNGYKPGEVPLHIRKN